MAVEEWANVVFNLWAVPRRLEVALHVAYCSPWSCAYVCVSGDGVVCDLLSRFLTDLISCPAPPSYCFAQVELSDTLFPTSAQKQIKQIHSLRRSISQIR